MHTWQARMCLRDRMCVSVFVSLLSPYIVHYSSIHFRFSLQLNKIQSAQKPHFHLCIHLLMDIWMADRIALLLWICINKLEWESISIIGCRSFVMVISGVPGLWGSSCFNILRNSTLISTKTRLKWMSEITPMKCVLCLIKLFRLNLPLS